MKRRKTLDRGVEMHITIPAVKVEKRKRVIKIARTIADLEGSIKIKKQSCGGSPTIQTADGIMKHK